VKIWQEVEGAVGYIFMYLFISFARQLRVGDRGPHLTALLYLLYDLDGGQDMGR
jgi:hypothetical protein